MKYREPRRARGVNFAENPRMWLLCIEAGFVGFLACLGGWIWYGFGRDGLARRTSPAWFIAAAVFFSLMCYALPHYPRP